MKVLLLTTHLDRGGISRYVLNLARGLRRRGEEVWIGSRGGEWLKEFNLNHIFLPLYSKSFFSRDVLKSFFIIRRFILSKGVKFDLVHSNTRVTQALGFLLYKFLGIPYVSTFHGYYKKRLTRKLFKFEGNLTIAISNQVKKHLEEDFNIKNKKLYLIYHGVEEGDYLCRESKQEVQKKYGIEGTPLIGTICRLAKEKNIEGLIEAFSLLLKDYPSAQLLISGRGNLKEKLKVLGEEKGLGRRILFLEDIEPGQIFKMLDVFCLVSRQEGFGLSVLEAQVSGVPVVVSSEVGSSEIIKDGLEGIIVSQLTPQQIYKAIKKVLESQDLKTKIINQARKKVREEFNLERMVSSTVKVYKELLAFSSHYTPPIIS